MVVALSPQSVCQISRTKVRVALQHLEFLVPADGTDLGDVEPALEQARDRFMTKVVKVQIRAARALTKVLPGEPDGVAAHWDDAVGLPRLRQLPQCRGRAARQGNVAGLAVLGLG